MTGFGVVVVVERAEVVVLGLVVDIVLTVEVDFVVVTPHVKEEYVTRKDENATLARSEKNNILDGGGRLVVTPMYD